MRMPRPLTSAVLALILALPLCTQRRAAFTMAQVLHYPYTMELAAAERGDAIAWVRDLDGVREMSGSRRVRLRPGASSLITPRMMGRRSLSSTFSPDGVRLVYVRGGDQDANWPAEGNLAPESTSSPEQPLVTEIWTTCRSLGVSRRRLPKAIRPCDLFAGTARLHKRRSRLDHGARRSG